MSSTNVVLGYTQLTQGAQRSLLMRYYQLLLLSFALFLQLNSQESSKDSLIQNFFRQDLTRKTLDFTLSTSRGIGTFERTNPGRDLQHLSFLFGSFSSLENSPRIQKTINTFVSSSFTGETNYNFDSNRNLIASDLQFGSARITSEASIRLYQPSNWYVELRPNFTVSYSDGSDINHSYNAIGGMAAGVGKGRVELVSHAWSAVRIIEDLSSAGVISNDMSYDEYWEFAELLADLNNLRRLDTRMKRVFELTEIGNFLIDKEVVATDDVLFMAQLSDTYRNERFVERLSGHRWLLFGESIVSRRVTSSNEKSDSNFGGGLNYFYHKPIKKQWQLNIIGGAKFETNPFFNTFTEDKPDLVTEVNLSTTFGYYPNARTNFEFNLEGAWTEYLSNDFIFDIDTFTLAAGINGQYFLSPFTSFNANITYRTDDRRPSFFTAGSKKVGLQFGVSHTLF